MKILAAFAALTVAGLASDPTRCLAGAARGLHLCADIVIPSLFPFFVCAKLLIETGAARRLGVWCGGVMRPLFNVPGSAGVAFVLGILSGYPLGAQCGADLYEQNLCTKAEAQRVVCFCNNSGPLFIVGAVGAGLLHSRAAGILLYVIHILSALSVGIVFRFYKKNERMTLPCAAYRMSKTAGTSVGSVLSSAIRASAELMLYVCGFIVFFSAFTSVLERFGVIWLVRRLCGVFGLTADAARAMGFGVFEITSGAERLAALPAGGFKIVLISMLLAWSGVSVLLQVTGILAKSGLNPAVFVGAKLLQSAFAGLYAMLLTHIPLAAPVFADRAPSSPEAWRWALMLTLTAAAALSLPALAYAVRRLRFVRVKPPRRNVKCK
ncbi:MAG: hypothetical protein LBH54_00220 [Clostridiales bacterium]|nr:hypothetical protein [Clostridiales bacterium]